MITKFTLKNEIIENNSSLLNSNGSDIIYSSMKKEVIESHIFDAVNGDISAERLTEHLFPEKKPHVFISHSSKYVSSAIKLANTLYEKYEIISFIDSQFWAHIDHALKEMHEKYCKNINSSTYSYTNSNNLLSHMHAILSMALIGVMDNADSLIFIESENSIYQKVEQQKINPSDIIYRKSETLSPWISSEINFSNKLRLKGHDDRGKLTTAGLESHAVSKSNNHLAEDGLPRIIHEINFSGFIPITEKSFIQSMEITKSKPIDTLDTMYRKYYQDYVIA